MGRCWWLLFSHGSTSSHIVLLRESAACDVFGRARCYCCCCCCSTSRRAAGEVINTLTSRTAEQTNEAQEEEMVVSDGHQRDKRAPCLTFSVVVEESLTLVPFPGPPHSSRAPLPSPTPAQMLLFLLQRACMERTTAWLRRSPGGGRG